ncbi:hypothetical protein YWH7199_00615 [Fusobacterium nucleatum YWH7199]|uniref:hypothetical protein n=1 Tax=Fusobacterium nucleatum TaxID=851 RepID=UPI00201A6B4C|nr:hypothetical protein [Fusobacterium nucleatum]MCL4580067.1 hypothetical protein [Fusobacterium nucleatum YWH7199]
MIRIRILTKFETDIDEVNRLLEEGWEFEQIFRGITKEIYILHKYIQEEEDIRKEKRKESIFTLIGETIVFSTILIIVVGLLRKYFI